MSDRGGRKRKDRPRKRAQRPVPSEFTTGSFKLLTSLKPESTLKSFDVILADPPYHKHAKTPEDVVEEWNSKHFPGYRASEETK